MPFSPASSEDASQAIGGALHRAILPDEPLVQITSNDLSPPPKSLSGALQLSQVTAPVTSPAASLAAAVNPVAAVSGYTNYDGVWLAASAAPTKILWGVGTASIIAGAGNLELHGSGQGELMVGGAGDDTFVLGSTKDVIQAGPSGVDTLVAALDYALPNGVQNLILDGTWESVVGVGNAMANIITADRAGETIYGGGGDDVLVSAGGDTFLFQPGTGKDVIVNFNTGGATPDLARLTGFGFTSFAQVRSAMTQVGSDVVLKLSPTDLIDFRNTTLANFTAANFQLQLNTTSMTTTFDDEFASFSQWNPNTGAGIWRTDYGWAPINSLSDHTLVPGGELSIDVDPTFAGSGTKPLWLNPFSISSTGLTITARPTYQADKALLWNYAYTSGLITTENSFSQTYGYFEIKAKLPSNPAGMWPAFWLLPVNANGSADEIDVFEAVNDNPNTVHATVHWDTANGPTQLTFPTYVPNLWGGAFHTFGVLWTASTITWFVDGTAVGSLATPPGLNKPMYMLANLAIGGNWTGAPSSSSEFPATYQIAYMRAYSMSTAPLTITGGTGNDTFYVHNSADVIKVNAGVQNETVIADVSYSLPAYVQNLTVTGSGLTAIGNNLNNILTSLGGPNTLVGGAGVDTFYVNNVGDKVVAPPNQGQDKIIATVSYALPNNVQNLTVKGSGLTATGNALNDSLTSLGGANTLVGGTGADTFYVNNVGDKVVAQANAVANAIVSTVSFTASANVTSLQLLGTGLTATAAAGGHTLLISADGGNTLVGGAGGHDVFDIFHANDVVVVAAGTVGEAIVSTVSYTAPANVQILTVNGAGLTATANDQGDVLTSLGGPNTLIGGAGTDTFYVNNIGDQVVAQSGHPGDQVVSTVSFTAPANIQTLTVNGSGLTATANGLGDVLISQGGPNTLVGGAGTDTFYVNNAGDQVVAQSGHPGDQVFATVSFTAPANIQTLTVTGSGLTATANGLGDVLTSLGGPNTLVGGAGGDIFHVNNVGDQVVVQPGQAGDEVISTVSFAMPANVHAMVLIGSGLTATGGASGGNYLISTDGGNTLIGGAAGGDVFIVSHPNDIIQVAAGTPNETVKAYSSFTLPANVQNLIAYGSAAFTLVGNGQDDTITASKGPDTITGGGGNDTFVFAPGDHLETITDFRASGNLDQIDIAAYQKAGLTETFIDHGTYASIAFSNGDVINLSGVHASSLYISGHFIL